MKRFVSVCLIIALCFTMASCGSKLSEEDRTLYIVKEGNSRYSIVIAQDAEAEIEYAATQLASYIAQATGVELPVVGDGSQVDAFISIGDTAQWKSSDLPSDHTSLNNDGYEIIYSGDNIFIDAANNRGLLYGVYDFLEKYCGIRFLSPDFTYVPKISEVACVAKNVRRVPEFRQRNFYNYWVGKNPQFEARTGMYSDMGSDSEIYGTGTEWYNKISTHHSCLDYVPEDVYKDTHPEFYSSFTRDNKTGYDDLCYTNGITDDGKIDSEMEISVAKAVVESLKKFIADDEDAVYFMFGIHDNATGFCQCERCKNSYAENGTRAGTICVFVNAVMREINTWLEKTYPGREVVLVIFAYLWCEDPPVKNSGDELVPYNDKVRLLKNIAVRIAPIEANYAYGMTSEKNVAVQRVLDGWSVLADELMLWDYTAFFYDGYNQYFPDLCYLKENLQYYKSRGVSYVMNQSSHTAGEDWQGALKYYVSSKLYWDLDLSVSDLVDEFILYYHGETAAPYVREFLQLMENHYAYLRSEYTGLVYYTVQINAYNSYEYMPLQWLEQASAILKRGRAAIAEDDSLSDAEKAMYEKNITGALLIPQYMILKNYDSYYHGGSYDFAREFYSNAQLYGVTGIDEVTSLSTYIAAFGIA